MARLGEGPVDKSKLKNIKEVAALLRVSEKTAYSLAREGGLPFFKVGGQWRVRASDLDKWSKAQVRTVVDAPAVSFAREPSADASYAAPRPADRTPADRTASLGFEDKLWLAADVLRNNMDPSEFKHVVLGLIFLKYVSDAFEERRDVMRAGGDADRLEDRKAYTSANVFWLPPAARWAQLRARARQPNIGKLLDQAMEAVEEDNPTLKGALPRVFALPALDKHKLGELVNLISDIGLGSKEHRDKDTLGRVYEYFLSRFASAEGRGGGEFYTPTSIVRVLVEMLEPFGGRVYDPCCGSGGMFVQSLRFIHAHGGQRDAVTVYGQESNLTTWRMARMNMAIRGIEARLGTQHADTFHEDLHPDVRADFVLANPPFNISNWGGDRLAEDVRWRYGTPPPSNANFAWLQHIVHHLSPNGSAGVVLANGAMSSQQAAERDIRRKLVEADLVDCMVALPGQLFYATQIPVSLWFLTRNKGKGRSRSRKGEVFFIDARRLGRMETRVHRVLDPEDIRRIADAYHAWRDGKASADVSGFCRAATSKEIEAHGFVLTPGRYVGAQEVEEDSEPFDDKVERLISQLAAERAEGTRIDRAIGSALAGLGYRL
jgi:type I restriction enzyme M protein